MLLEQSTLLNMFCSTLQVQQETFVPNASLLKKNSRRLSQQGRDLRGKMPILTL
jgi:hypothetical protein